MAMHIKFISEALPPSPVSVQSCFFCGMPVVSETACAVRDMEGGRRLGWSCTACLSSDPDHLQRLVGTKMQTLRRLAEQRYHEAEALCIQADKLEHILHGLRQLEQGNDS
jgi:hypothetical protein